MNWILFKFITIGPAIGCVVFNAIKDYPHLLEQLSTTASPLFEIVSFLGGVVFVGILGLFLAYPIGIFPAAASGFAYSFILKRYASSNFSWPMRIVIGAFIGLLITSPYGGFLFSPQNSDLAFQTVLAWSISGLLAGALCAVSIGEKNYTRIKEEA